MLRRLVLHGSLKHLYAGDIEIYGTTVAEVIEGASRQIEGFKPNPKTGRVRIAVVGCHSEADLHRYLGDQIEIHIVPQMAGGKKGGIAQILIGAVLIGVGVFLGVATGFGSMLIKLGALQLLGGLAQMLSPTPEDDRSSQTKSNYLGSPKNTTKIGTRIPVLYGEYRWGGHILSFDINAIEIPGTGTSTSSGGGK